MEELRGADGTRRRILDAAAELFEESGYGNVSLSDVVRRSGVSRGAFNHHFPNKESLAAALMMYAEAELAQKIRSEASESSSALENLIRASFAQQNLILNDAKVSVGIRLAQSINQFSGTPIAELAPNWTALFQAGITEAVAAGDLYRHVDGRKLGYVLWCGIVANNMVAHTSGMNPIEGLATIWGVHLRGAASATSLGYYQKLVQRIASQYLSNGPDPSG